MSYAAKILADSIASGVRLTTLEVTMPRIVLAEFNTHRMLSRNSASSRAIPVEKRIAAVRESPFVPDAFAANKKGMQAGEALDESAQSDAQQAWLWAASKACTAAADLAAVGVHKQWANRLLEPFSWHTVIVTATEWENFFNLRISPEAQPEIRRVAELMKAAMDARTPRVCRPGDWHLPLVTEDEKGNGVPDDFEVIVGSVKIDVFAHLAKLSVARCARVSYLTHDGRRDVAADIALYDRLLKSGHMSPFEHAAIVADETVLPGTFVGNFRAPWVQYRKTLPGEAVFRKAAT